MTHKVLIINSSAEKNLLLANACKELERKDFSFDTGLRAGLI